MTAQLDIIKIALDLYGDDLRKQAKQTDVRDRWLQNVGKYLDALDEGETEGLRLPHSNTKGATDYDQVLAEVLKIQSAEKAMEGKEDEDRQEDDDEDDTPAEIDDDDDDRLIASRGHATLETASPQPLLPLCRVRGEVKTPAA